LHKGGNLIFDYLSKKNLHRHHADMEFVHLALNNITFFLLFYSDDGGRGGGELKHCCLALILTPPYFLTSWGEDVVDHLLSFM